MHLRRFGSAAAVLSCLAMCLAPLPASATLVQTDPSQNTVKIDPTTNTVKSTTADGANLTAGATTDSACASDTATCTQISLMKRELQRLTTAISTLTGQQGPVTAGAATATQSWLAGCRYVSTMDTFATSNQGALTCGPRGALYSSIADATTTSIASVQFISSDGVSDTAGLAVNAYLQGFNGTTRDRVRVDVNGLVTQAWAFSASRWNFAAATGGIVNTATAVTIKTAAGASVRNYLNSCQISHDTLGGVTELAIRDGAAGTVLWRQKLQTAATEGTTFHFDAPLRGTANTLMEVVTLTAVTGGVYVNCQGFTGT